MTLAQAAKYAIQLRGIYDGPDVNRLTKASLAALAGQGLVAAADDNYPRDGTTFVIRGQLRRSRGGRGSRQVLLNLIISKPRRVLACHRRRWLFHSGNNVFLD